MAVWSCVNLSYLNLDRFDSEYFRPDYLNNIRKINSSGQTTSLRKLFRIIHRGTQPKYTTTGKVIALRSVNVGSLSFNTVRQEYVTEHFRLKNPKGSVIKDDVLITSTVVGTLGRTSVWPYKHEAYCDGHITILRDARVSPYLVALYLSTQYGLLQIDKNIRGSSGQIEIYPYDIGKILIPNILINHQQEIEELVVRAFEDSIKSEEQLRIGQKLLESELGLDKLNFDKPIAYSANFSELELSRRFDSEHYYPAFDNLKKQLPHHVQLVALGTLLNFCQRGKQPAYSEAGLPVLNSKHILENKITLEGNRYAQSSLVPSLQIQYGDVLINGTGRGTIGRTAPYLINEHQAIPDNHVTILRSSRLDPAYLSFYLNALPGKLQVDKYQRGSSGQLELYPFDIRKFQVWEAPQSIQLEIRRLYEQATENAKQSRALLEQAKTRVEQLIEAAVQA